MKQKITTGIITALLMTVLPINSVYAAESYNMADIDGYTAVYFLDENSDAVVTEIRGDFSEINIPQQIDGHNVTGIDRYAFFENTQLVSVSLPDTVQTIGDYAFSGCLSLENINIPENLSSLGKACFMSCISLGSIAINGNLKEIPENCFASCTKLSYADIPFSVTDIGEKAFFGCTSLNDIALHSNITSFADSCIGAYSDARSGIIYKKDFTIMAEKNSPAENYASEHSLSFREIIKGDINGDSIIDSGDASSILAEYSKLSTKSPLTFRSWQKIAADCDNNSSINSSDASEVLKMYAFNQTDSN